MTRDDLRNVPATVTHITLDNKRTIVYEGPRVKAWNFKIRSDNSRNESGNFIVTLNKR
jgi:hypothetical protein